MIAVMPVDRSVRLPLGRREFGAITYRNEYKGVVNGVEVRLASIVFDYSIRAREGCVVRPPQQVRYVGKATALLDPADGQWKLQRLELGDKGLDEFAYAGGDRQDPASESKAPAAVAPRPAPSPGDVNACPGFDWPRLSRALGREVTGVEHWLGKCRLKLGNAAAHLAVTFRVGLGTDDAAPSWFNKRECPRGFERIARYRDNEHIMICSSSASFEQQLGNRTVHAAAKRGDRSTWITAVQRKGDAGAFDPWDLPAALLIMASQIMIQ
jgi:hypothetical protein